MTYRCYDSPLGLVLDTGPSTRVLPFRTMFATYCESVTSDRPGQVPRSWFLVTALDTRVQTNEHGIVTGAGLDDVYIKHAQPTEERGHDSSIPTSERAT